MKIADSEAGKFSKI